MNPLRAVGRGIKAAATSSAQFVMRWGGRAALWSALLWPQSRIDYERAVGNGLRSSVLMAVIRWVARAFPEAPFMVYEVQDDGTKIPRPKHALVKLLRRPNPFYSGVTLWAATLIDYVPNGNAYWIKQRAIAGNVLEVWWVPRHMMTPIWPDDGKTYISHYEYKYDATKPPAIVPRENVVHFRDGLDPENVRLGLSSLGSLLREIVTDEEAASFTAALLKNMGVPGVIISPDSDEPGDPEQALETKANFMSKFTGDKRGEPLVMLNKTKVQIVSFSPEQMDLKALRRVPEERVTAVTGVPAIVVGLGAGLDRATYANMAEAREAAYEGFLIPTQRSLSEDVQMQLMPDFDDPEQFEAGFDLTNVRVLQPDADKLFARVNTAVTGGWYTLAQALSDVGKPTGPEHDYYLRPLNVVAIPTTAAAVATTDAANSETAKLLPPPNVVRTKLLGIQEFSAATTETFRPRAGGTIAATPRVIIITDDDLAQAAEDFDDMVDAQYQGMLDAPVEDAEDGSGDAPSGDE